MWHCDISKRFLRNIIRHFRSFQAVKYLSSLWWSGRREEISSVRGRCSSPRWRLCCLSSPPAPATCWVPGKAWGGWFFSIFRMIIFIFLNPSCAAYPFRSVHVYWSKGCPHHAPCCSEFGYCRPRVRQSLPVLRSPEQSCTFAGGVGPRTLQGL